MSNLETSRKKSGSPKPIQHRKRQRKRDVHSDACFPLLPSPELTMYSITMLR